MIHVMSLTRNAALLDINTVVPYSYSYLLLYVHVRVCLSFLVNLGLCEEMQCLQWNWSAGDVCVVILSTDDLHFS